MRQAFFPFISNEEEVDYFVRLASDKALRVSAEALRLSSLPRRVFVRRHPRRHPAYVGLINDERALGFCKRFPSGIIGIFVLHNLAPRDAFVTTAHELRHVWQFASYFPDKEARERDADLYAERLYARHGQDLLS